MRSTKSENKLYDILPPPLEKITKEDHGKTKLISREVENKRQKEKEHNIINKEPFEEVPFSDMTTHRLFSENRKDEMKEYEEIHNPYYVNNINMDNTNNNRNAHMMNEKKTAETESAYKTKINNELNFSNMYEDIILNKDEINAVIKENEQFRNLMEDETINIFMDECLKDPLKTFEKYKSDKKVLTFLQLLLDFMCAKYSYNQLNNLQNNFTFEKKNH